MSFLARIEEIQATAYFYEMAEKCWKEALSEPTGLEIIKAAKICRERKVAPFRPSSKITFSCGREITIEPEIRAALKKDSFFFSSLFFVDDVALTNVTYEQFEKVVKALYEDASFDEVECLCLADYLHIPCLFYKALNRLKDKIKTCTLNEALYYNDTFASLLHFSFAKELLEELSSQFEKFEPDKIKRVAALSLTKNILLPYSSFTNLTSLRISHPDVDEKAIVVPSSLRALSLTLSKTISDSIVLRFPTYLTKLMLGCTKVSNVTLAGLSNRPLTTLNIAGCDGITDEGVALIPLTVTDLNISSTQVTIASLSRLTSLTKVNIVGCNIHGSDLGRLTAVELTLSHITNEELPFLSRKLRRLNMFEPHVTTLEGLPPISELRAPKCPIGDDGLLHLSRALFYLDLSYNASITALGILLIPRTVRHLILWRCSNINDEALKALPRRLLYLDVSGCQKITDEGMKYLPRSLTELDMDGCSNITDAAIPYLPVNLSKIHYAKTQITKKL